MRFYTEPHLGLHVCIIAVCKIYTKQMTQTELRCTVPRTEKKCCLLPDNTDCVK